MTKKFLAWSLAIIILGVGVYLVFGKNENPAKLFGEDIKLLVYTINEVPTDHAFLDIPFLKNTDRDWYVNVYLDNNDDGELTDDEIIVANNLALVKDNYRNRFSVGMNDFDKTEGEVEALVFLSSSILENPLSDSEGAGVRSVSAKIESYKVDDYISLDAPGASVDLKRGVGLIAYAEDVDVQLDREVPDMSGGPMDCFPIATANNLISLATANNERDRLPENPTDIVNELKRDMQFNDGVLNRNFMAGKAAFVTRHQLPVTTTAINFPSFENIKNAIENGGAVEVSTRMIRSASGKKDTGHVMTGIGVMQTGGDMGLALHDPATPEGADVYELKLTDNDPPYLILDYPLWDGIVLIDAIYVQTWNVATEEEENRTALDSDMKEVDVLVIGGKNYPVFQFRKSVTGGHDNCGAQHWHTDMPQVFAIGDDRNQGIIDPNPNSCGFGKVGEVPETKVLVSETDAASFVGNLP